MNLQAQENTYNEDQSTCKFVKPLQFTSECFFIESVRQEILLQDHLYVCTHFVRYGKKGECAFLGYLLSLKLRSHERLKTLTASAFW